MKIEYHKQFLKHYRKRIQSNPNLVKKFRERLAMLLTDPHSCALKDHKLVGELQTFRAFALNGDFRVVYRIKEDAIFLYDVGTHNQVY